MTLKIDLWPLAKIKPYEKNPRRNDEAVAGVAESIKQFGFPQPIVVDPKGVIVAGHTRYKAAQQLGLDKVPVHVATGLTPAQLRAYRLADNRTGEVATWDKELLAAELASIDEEGLDLALLGFAAELKGDGAGLTDPDDVPEQPKKPRAKPGELWKLLRDGARAALRRRSDRTLGSVHRAEGWCEREQCTQGHQGIRCH